MIRALLVIVLVLGCGPSSSKKPKLNSVDKQEVQRSRKKLFSLRKTVESSYYCRNCKGSKTNVSSTPSRRIKGMSDQYEVHCPTCGGTGIGLGADFQQALDGYYGIIAANEERLRPWLEDPPTLARWLLNHLKDPLAAHLLNQRWKSASANVREGHAFIVSLRVLKLVENPDPKWAIVVAETMEPEGIRGKSILLVFQGWYPPVNPFQEATGTANILVVGYNEGPEAHKRWLEKARKALEQRRIESHSSEIDSDAGSSLEKLEAVIAAFPHCAFVLTVDDGIPLPRHFAKD